MDLPYTSRRTTASYTTRLDQTLKTLQDRVREQEAVLERLQGSNSSVPTQPCIDDKSHLWQIRCLNATYESLNVQDPYLPSPESSLPALLALRSIQGYIDETEKSITNSELELNHIQNRLEEDRSNFKDATLIQNHLETRALSLQGEIEERSQKTSDQMAKEWIREIRNKKNHYDGETGKLVKAFNEFIDNHLAPMLAAEELGGPIVGEASDIDQDMLEGGFNAHGKSKRSKKGFSEEKRQRRIDEIWGPEPSDNRKSKQPWDEKQAAGAEMRELTEQLLNSLVETDGGVPVTYVELERESAAARYLVRSKVAQFHPRDARKLRLIDFGREIEVSS